jgi:hypothetical protein
MKNVNLNVAFEQFKIDIKLEPLLLKCSRASAFGEHIYNAVKAGKIREAVCEIQEQIADGHTDVIIKIIGLEAYKLIVY